MRFESFDFAPEILRAVSDCGYQEMTPVQQQAIPAIRRGRDVLASAQTGTGKTAAFALPILQRLVDNPAPVQPSNARVLILTPTRELAAQVASNINDFAKYLDITTITIVGGGKQDVQAKKLKAGAHIIVATPGRLLEHLTACNLSLSGIECLVMDEADRILDMGFSADVQKILQAVNKTRQNLLFSATFSDAVKKLANLMLDRPQIVSVNKQNSTADTVSHTVYPVEQKRKRELLSELIGKQNWQQVLVFASTRESCDVLVEELNLDGIKSAVVHGEKAQGNRRRALREFMEGKVRVLVATEVAARGLDIPDLEYVVNYDLPFLAEDYVHRIGRTGRAGQQGLALSLYQPNEAQRVNFIEEYQQAPMPLGDLDSIGRDIKPIAPQMVTLSIDAGRKTKVRAGDILGALTGEGGIAGADVGKIQISEQYSYVAVKRSVASAALKRLQEGKIKGRSYRARKLG